MQRWMARDPSKIQMHHAGGKYPLHILGVCGIQTLLFDDSEMPGHRSDAPDAFSRPGLCCLKLVFQPVLL